MPHNVQPNQRVKLLTVQIAVPADMEPGACADGISALLSENGICAKDPWVLDWRYMVNFEKAVVVQADAHPTEGDIFDADQADPRIIAYIPETGWVKGRGHKVAFVTEGEAGYSTGEDAASCKAAWYWGNGDNCAKSLKQAQETAVAYNAKLGIDEKTAMEILCSSMRASNMQKGKRR